jgi:hypothetical protein
VMRSDHDRSGRLANQMANGGWTGDHPVSWWCFRLYERLLLHGRSWCWQPYLSRFDRAVLYLSHPHTVETEFSTKRATGKMPHVEVRWKSWGTDRVLRYGLPSMMLRKFHHSFFRQEKCGCASSKAENTVGPRMGAVFGKRPI